MYTAQTGRSLFSNKEIQEAINNLPQDSMATVPNNLPENIAEDVAELLRKKTRFFDCYLGLPLLVTSTLCV